jgi:hypothetical protein
MQAAQQRLGHHRIADPLGSDDEGIHGLFVDHRGTGFAGPLVVPP